MERGMVTGADNDVEVSGWAPVQPGIALAGDANALSIAGACLDSHFKGLGALDCPFAMADRAGGNVLSGPVTARASHVELHASTRLLDCPLAFALRTYARRLDVAIPVTIAADIAAGNGHPRNAPPRSAPETDGDPAFCICLPLRVSLLGCAGPFAAKLCGN